MSDETILTREHMEDLMAQVYALVEACPAGKVTTYGWIGKALGYPRGARMIGWIMNEATSAIPAQRVVNSKGELSGSWAFGQKGRMRQLLEAEGVQFAPDEHIDLKRYSWDPTRDLSPDELQSILSKATGTHAFAPTPRLVSLLLNDVASPFRGNTQQS